MSRQTCAKNRATVCSAFTVFRADTRTSSRPSAGTTYHQDACEYIQVVPRSCSRPVQKVLAPNPCEAYQILLLMRQHPNPGCHTQKSKAALETVSLRWTVKVHEADWQTIQRSWLLRKVLAAASGRLSPGPRLPGRSAAQRAPGGRQLGLLSTEAARSWMCIGHHSPQQPLGL